MTTALHPSVDEVWHWLSEVPDPEIPVISLTDLGITEITVKLHRSNVMRKMQASSVGELIRAWEKLPTEIRETVAA